MCEDSPQHLEQRSYSFRSACVFFYVSFQLNVWGWKKKCKRFNVTVQWRDHRNWRRCWAHSVPGFWGLNPRPCARQSAALPTGPTGRRWFKEFRDLASNKLYSYWLTRTYSIFIQYHSKGIPLHSLLCKVTASVNLLFQETLFKSKNPFLSTCSCQKTGERKRQLHLNTRGIKIWVSNLWLTIAWTWWPVIHNNSTEWSMWS